MTQRVMQAVRVDANDVLVQELIISSTTRCHCIDVVGASWRIGPDDSPYQRSALPLYPQAHIIQKIDSILADRSKILRFRCTCWSSVKANTNPRSLSYIGSCCNYHCCYTRRFMVVEDGIQTNVGASLTDSPVFAPLSHYGAHTYPTLIKM